jgi:alpha-pyrone synthase
MSYITDIQTSLPKHTTPLPDFLEWVAQFHEDDSSIRKLHYLAKESGITNKYTVINDFRNSTEDEHLYHWKTNGYHEPTTAGRMEVFLPLATKLATDAAQKCICTQGITPISITHIITVSCTGMAAPGLEIELCKTLRLSPDVQRSSVNFMGCYAAFHALKQADYICRATPDSKVLIVSVELCSLHFRNNESNDNLLSIVLFSDGAAAAIVESQKPDTPYLDMVDFSSTLITEGERDMSWQIGDAGFEMQLKNQVPKHIQNHIQEVFFSLLDKNKIKQHQIAGYAIHPGGKNILKAFENAMNCNENDLQESYSVLRECGNMSSATVLFVLKKMLHSNNNGFIFSAAFGPGLTVESGLLEKCIP